MFMFIMFSPKENGIVAHFWSNSCAAATGSQPLGVDRQFWRRSPKPPWFCAAGNHGGFGGLFSTYFFGTSQWVEGKNYGKASYLVGKSMVSASDFPLNQTSPL